MFRVTHKQCLRTLKCRLYEHLILVLTNIVHYDCLKHIIVCDKPFIKRLFNVYKCWLDICMHYIHTVTSQRNTKMVKGNLEKIKRALLHADNLWTVEVS